MIPPKPKLLLILILGFGILVLGALPPLLGQQEPDLPVISTASVPGYPPAARIAGIQGEVRISVSTDGRTVSSMTVEHGHPILASAAQDNIRTWKFEPHRPAIFTVTFRYEIEKEATCKADNGTVILRLPTDIQIKVKGIETCDPTGGNR